MTTAPTGPKGTRIDQRDQFAILLYVGRGDQNRPRAPTRDGLSQVFSIVIYIIILVEGLQVSCFPELVSGRTDELSRVSASVLALASSSAHVPGTYIYSVE